MPNGGADCCGTCWFNRNNKGEAGYGHSRSPEAAFCTIRDLPIENPFWTYCANHPHRGPDRDNVPIGPVWVDEGKGRRIWKPSPDTEAVRQHHLELLARIEEQPKAEYPAGTYRDEVVVNQLGELRERRVLPDLERVAAFDARATAAGELFNRTRESLVAGAQWALRTIRADTGGES